MRGDLVMVLLDGFSVSLIKGPIGIGPAGAAGLLASAAQARTLVPDWGRLCRSHAETLHGPSWPRLLGGTLGSASAALSQDPTRRCP